MAAYGKTSIGLVQFLGSNCDFDVIDGFKRHFSIDIKTIWHTETSLPKLDGLILPGGFSYGDFLRSGALASHTKIMSAVREYAKAGGAILGICNGFQILTESHILPGALLKNDCGTFVAKYLDLQAGEGTTGYHRAFAGKTLRIPIAHGEGRYFIESEGYKKLVERGQIVLRYQENPNGSLDNIAGIVSENGRVLGLMPHPERATEKLIGGSDDGKIILKAFLESCF
jgi:phosphoribosylformylglycinamidine synthase I